MPVGPLIDRSVGRYRWRVVGMLWLVCVLSYADRQVIFSIFPRLKEDFGFSPVQLGLIGSAFMWVYAGGGPVAGLLADRISRKKIILAACAFWSLVTALTAACTGFAGFMVVRALGGAGECFYQPSAMSLLSDYHGVRTRSRALSLHQSGVYFGTIAGGWFGGWCAARFGWRVGFVGFGVAGLLVAGWLSRGLRESPRAAIESSEGQSEPARKPGPVDTAKGVFRRPVVGLLMAAFVCANFVANVFLSWTPTFLVEKFGLSLGTAGLLGGICIHLASMVSVPVGGWAADKLFARSGGGRILVQTAGLLGAAGFVALVGLAHEMGAVLTAMVGFGLCKGLYDANIFASLYDVVEPGARGSAAGIMNTIGWTGGALGPLAMGLAMQYGPYAKEIDNMRAAIVGCAVANLVGVGFLVVAARAVGRPTPSPAKAELAAV